jgi:hypothetical protein
VRCSKIAAGHTKGRSPRRRTRFQAPWGVRESPCPGLRYGGGPDMSVGAKRGARSSTDQRSERPRRCSRVQSATLNGLVPAPAFRRKRKRPRAVHMTLDYGRRTSFRTAGSVGLSASKGRRIVPM